jgi:hypothetical protein
VLFRFIIYEVEQKTHKRCGGVKHITNESRMVLIEEFYKNKGNKDGLCKNCYIYSCYGGKRIRQKQVVIPEFNINTLK